MTFLVNEADDPKVARTAEDFRAVHPNVSLPRDFSAADLAGTGWAVLDRLARPQDTREQRFSPVIQLMDGKWVEAWQPRETTQAEKDQWDENNKPEPNFDMFVNALINHPVLANVYGGILIALQQPPPALTSKPQAAQGLGLGLLAFRLSGDTSTFLTSWRAAYQVGTISQDVITVTQELARQCHLPDTFVSDLDVSFP